MRWLREPIDVPVWFVLLAVFNAAIALVRLAAAFL